MKDNIILKTAIVFMIASVGGLFMPVIGQYYEQQTGITPIVFYMISGIGSFIITLFSILKIWGEIK